MTIFSTPRINFWLAFTISWGKAQAMWAKCGTLFSCMPASPNVCVHAEKKQVKAEIYCSDQRWARYAFPSLPLYLEDSIPCSHARGKKEKSIRPKLSGKFRARPIYLGENTLIHLILCLSFLFFLILSHLFLAPTREWTTSQSGRPRWSWSNLRGSPVLSLYKATLPCFRYTRFARKGRREKAYYVRVRGRSER